MNEAENTLTLPKEISSEVFFKEEARRIGEAFNSKSNELDLEYLRHQLKCMKSLATSLELPWDRFIPILFRSLTLLHATTGHKYKQTKNGPVNCTIN